MTLLSPGRGKKKDNLCLIISRLRFVYLSAAKNQLFSKAKSQFTGLCNGGIYHYLTGG